MPGKKIVSFKKLAKKVKVIGGGKNQEPSQHECLLRGFEDDMSPPAARTPTGFFAVYVGEERERFVVPTSFLSHPLFKMLLEKAYSEYGLDQTNKLVVPCSASAFQEVANAVECCNGKFDFGKLVEEFL
ncbi:SAUR family protein [Tripterygium wilfordii]|uniref:SAUR family protein n=2 Tax=Tripterygium wilfordii TaxID=458696 RepID=A0A7J7DWQ1_TRIWF|nr:SAUR family protein [Tripterygium wilfordii]